MTRRTLRAWLGAGLVAALSTASARDAAGQSDAARSSIVIVTGEEATVPIPTLMEGPHASLGNSDVADQLFLRLAQLGPTLITSGDRAFEPLLARSWTRRDSVTLAFDLDPRATWHDGVPVTSEDVVFTFARARDPAISPRLSALLRHITSVTAHSPRPGRRESRRRGTRRSARATRAGPARSARRGRTEPSRVCSTRHIGQRMAAIGGVLSGVGFATPVPRVC